MDNPMNGGRMEYVPNTSPFAHLGPEAATAYDPFAPVDEVEDASSLLMKAYGQTADAIDPGLGNLIHQFATLQQSEHHAEDLVAKAIRARESGEALNSKASTSSWGSEFGRGYFKWLPKRGVQLPVLRAFARRLEVAQAIIRTRKRQVERFSRPSRAVDQMGWRICMADEDAMAGEGIKEEMRHLTRMLECGGREFSPVLRREMRRQGMTQLLRYMTEDGLVLDNAAMELIGLKDTDQGLDSWYIRPSETFALASPEYKERMPDGRKIYAFQILNGRAETPFAHDELSIWIRNSSTWCEENGYGYSEFEQSLDTMNNFLQAMAYTKQGLSENSVPRGILMAYGNYDQKTQQAFKSAWAAKVRGVQNQFGTPVLFSRGQQGGVQYLNTGQPFDEMAFSKWISLNITIMGAIFGVAPEEIGMEGFSTEKSSLSGDDTSEKLAAAKDKGLHPLLKDAAAFISDEILARFNPDLRVEFTGLDSRNSEERWKEKLKNMTINEVRALFDMPEHPLGWFGDLPADPGMQSAEFQRVQQGATWGEARKMVGLSEYPSPMLNDSPVNPSLGALYQSVLMANPDGADSEDPGAAAGGDLSEAAPDANDEVTNRLKQLSRDEGPWKTLSDYKARAGVQEEENATA